MIASARTLFAVTAALLLNAGAPPVAAASTSDAGRPGVSPEKAPAAATGANEPNFVTLDGKTISAAQFDTALREAARQKFYHGTPPEREVEQLTREVAFEIVDRILLAAEARKRGLKPDAKAVQEAVARYEQRQSGNPRWKGEREVLLPSVRERFETENVIAQLETETRKVSDPAEEKVREYFSKHPDKFTEPEKLRVSVILLAVDPSSPFEAWQAAETQAGALRLQLTEGGANFAELARKHSQHESAQNGGDLGYLHHGMLPDGIQQAIDKMKPGDLSPATRVLQGFTLFRYDAYQPPKKHDFATVKGRAKDLLVRDLQNAAWDALREKLRAQARIDFNTQRYPALGQKAESGKK